MVLQIILADILVVARFGGARKNTTQLVKYPQVLSVKPSNKVYVLSVKPTNKVYILGYNDKKIFNRF